MKIFSTWSDELGAFQRFFEGHEVERLPKDFKGLEMDLLIFPGGHDVHPARYGSTIPENSQYAGWIDEKRDSYESSVFDAVMVEKLKTKKVLAVCRGMQFVNVCLGGSLYYDIQSRFGRSHPITHAINWHLPTVFSSIKTVNSIHHQALRNTGDNMRYRLLAVEPTTSITEAILWGDRILGMQFHPELWRDKIEMQVFSKGIIDWIEGKTSLVVGEKVEETPRKRLSGFEYGSSHQINSDWFIEPSSDEDEMPEEDDEMLDDEQDEEEE